MKIILTKQNDSHFHYTERAGPFTTLAGPFTPLAGSFRRLAGPGVPFRANYDLGVSNFQSDIFF